MSRCGRLRGQDSADDDQLIRGYQAGDLEAFRVFYDRNHRALFYYLLRRVGSRSVAEDLLQDVFFKIHKNIAQYDFRQRAIPWVFAIARNTVIDYFRKVKDVPDENMDRYESVGNSLALLKEELEAVLECLVPEDRRLIEERFLSEKSYDSIAHQEGSDPAAMRKKISRIIAKVRLNLGIVG